MLQRSDHVGAATTETPQHFLILMQSLASFLLPQEYEPDAKPFDKATTLKELETLSAEQFENAVEFMRCSAAAAPPPLHPTHTSARPDTAAAALLPLA